MPRRSKPSDPESLRKQLIDLLANFERELQNDELRTKVLALVPVFHCLRDLGSSLIPRATASSGMDRMLFYFRKYPRTILSGDELMVVAGIGDWPRRVRQQTICQATGHEINCC